MDFTTYNSYPKPVNEESYGDQYRNWADDLDVQVPQIGVLANRPASGPDNARYWAVDVGVLYRYETSTSEWIVLGGMGVGGGPGTTVQPTQHLQFSSGLQSEEIARYQLEGTEKLDVRRLGIVQKGGGNDPDLSIAVQDESDSSTLASTTSLAVGSAASPLGTSAAGADVTLRITNTTGNAQSVSIDRQLTIMRG